jgi:hypothetical protein
LIIRKKIASGFHRAAVTEYNRLGDVTEIYFPPVLEAGSPKSMSCKGHTACENNWEEFCLLHFLVAPGVHSLDFTWVTSLCPSCCKDIVTDLQFTLNPG